MFRPLREECVGYYGTNRADIGLYYGGYGGSYSSAASSDRENTGHMY